LAKEHVRSGLGRSRNEAKNQKDRFVYNFHHGCSISLKAPTRMALR
jgi:hypothetical protein